MPPWEGTAWTIALAVSAGAGFGAPPRRFGPASRGRLTRARRVVDDHRADGLAGMHEVERIVDAIERKDVRDEVVDVDFAFHVPVDDARHVGASPRTPEGGAFPDAPRHELERAGLDLLARTGDADDHRHAPSAMAALERLAHHIDVADALEAVVGAAPREV